VTAKIFAAVSLFPLINSRPQYLPYFSNWRHMLSRQRRRSDVSQSYPSGGDDYNLHSPRAYHNLRTTATYVYSGDDNSGNDNQGYWDWRRSVSAVLSIFTHLVLRNLGERVGLPQPRQTSAPSLEGLLPVSSQ
jgi:hypothetical protein